MWLGKSHRGSDNSGSQRQEKEHNKLQTDRVREIQHALAHLCHGEEIKLSAVSSSRFRFQESFLLHFIIRLAVLLDRRNTAK